MTTLKSKLSGLVLIASLFMTPAFAFADHGGGDGGRGKRVAQPVQSAVTTSAMQTPARTGDDNGKGNDGKNRGISTSNSGPGSSNSGRGNGNSRHGDDDCAVPTLPQTSSSTIPSIHRGDGDDIDDCQVMATTTPDITPPVLSAITATPGTTSATIAFNTGVPASANVFFGTFSPFSFTGVLSNASQLVSHSFSLVGLTASTTYFYVINATNAIGSAFSNFFTFTTAATPDVTPPVLSSIAATTTTSGTATLTWTTNESANSKVFFGTNTPLDLTSTTTNSVSSAALVTTHSVNVTGLATSTTFHFVVQSADASGNTATSSDVSLLIP